jgi:hypothetical protein
MGFSLHKITNWASNFSRFAFIGGYHFCSLFVGWPLIPKITSTSSMVMITMLVLPIKRHFSNGCFLSFDQTITNID